MQLKLDGFSDVWATGVQMKELHHVSCLHEGDNLGGFICAHRGVEAVSVRSCEVPTNFRAS